MSSIVLYKDYQDGDMITKEDVKKKFNSDRKKTKNIKYIDLTAPAKICFVLFVLFVISINISSVFRDQKVEIIKLSKEVKHLNDRLKINDVVTAMFIDDTRNFLEVVAKSSGVRGTRLLAENALLGMGGADDEELNKIKLKILKNKSKKRKVRKKRHGRKR